MEKLRFASAHELDGPKTPEEIANFEARLDLLLAIRDIVEAKGYSQKELQTRLNMSQPRISNLLNGHIEKFSLGKLIEILDGLGFSMDFQYKKSRKTARIQLNFENDLMPA
tara:strand:- start:2078 stop:2410 length:333 start_codon:yes stop_codon:yes gene_type:complete